MPERLRQESQEVKVSLEYTERLIKGEKGRIGGLEAGSECQSKPVQISTHPSHRLMLFFSNHGI